MQLLSLRCTPCATCCTNVMLTNVGWFFGLCSWQECRSVMEIFQPVGSGLAERKKRKREKKIWHLKVGFLTRSLVIFLKKRNWQFRVRSLTRSLIIYLFIYLSEKLRELDENTMETFRELGGNTKNPIFKNKIYLFKTYFQIKFRTKPHSRNNSQTSELLLKKIWNNSKK